MSVFEHNFTSISGASMPLRMWQGQPMLIVNTASQCSYNTQFRELQILFNEYKQSGLIVVAVPTNDFEQEPWEEDIIARYCESNYAIKFPMTSKQHVTGSNSHPLFRWVVETYGSSHAPRWNFQKYLFDRAGELIDSWPSAIEPVDPTIRHSIERNLNSWLI